MNPKTLNLAALAFVLLLILTAGYGLYDRGRQAERADSAETALAGLQEAYKRITTDYAATLAADSAALRAYRASDTARVIVRDRFRTLVDTLAYTDTVLVEAAEEALLACEHTLLRCAEARAAGDSVRANLEAQVANLEAQLATTRSIAAATCSGRVPTWTLPVAGLLGAAAGAWVRGE